MVFFANTLGSHDVTWTYLSPGWNSPRTKAIGVELVGLGDRKWNAKKNLHKTLSAGNLFEDYIPQHESLFKYKFVD